MVKNEKQTSTEKVLNFLGEKSLDFLDLGFKILFDPNQIIREYGFSLYKDPSRAVYNLKKSPYFAKQGKKLYITEKGRMKIIRNIIKKKKKERNFSDGWLGIIFDVPEINRRERDLLRKELCSAGCIELQKSVWITHLDIEKELLSLLKFWKKDFTGDIRFLKIKEISGEDEIKKRLKIN